MIRRGRQGRGRMSKTASGAGWLLSVPTYRPTALPTCLVLLALGCARGEPAPGVPPAAPSAPVQMKDSLVLSAPGGVEIWMTAGRPATDSKGATCIERSLEIRRGDGSKT